MTKVHSPEGLYAYAREYKVAAKTLIEQQKPGLIVPIAYLLTHALELALKSFLMFRGIEATAAEPPTGQTHVANPDASPRSEFLASST